MFYILYFRIKCISNLSVYLNVNVCYYLGSRCSAIATRLISFFPATCFYHEPYKLYRSMVFTRFVSVTFLGNIKFWFNSEPNRRIKRWPENVELHVLIAPFFHCRVILSVLVLKFLFSFVCCFELKLLKAQPCWKVLVRYAFDTFAQRNYATSTSTLTHDGLFMTPLIHTSGHNIKWQHSLWRFLLLPPPPFARP